MSRNNQHIASLFDENGSLKLEAMRDFAAGKLDAASRKIVENHLAEDELDREAMEGLMLEPSNQKIAETVTQIKSALAEKISAGEKQTAKKSGASEKQNADKSGASEKQTAKKSGAPKTISFQPYFRYAVAAAVALLFIFGTWRFVTEEIIAPTKQLAEAKNAAPGQELPPSKDDAATGQLATDPSTISNGATENAGGKGPMADFKSDGYLADNRPLPPVLRKEMPDAPADLPKMSVWDPSPAKKEAEYGIGVASETTIDMDDAEEPVNLESRVNDATGISDTHDLYAPAMANYARPYETAQTRNGLITPEKNKDEKETAGRSSTAAYDVAPQPNAGKFEDKIAANDRKKSAPGNRDKLAKTDEVLLDDSYKQEETVAGIPADLSEVSGEKSMPLGSNLYQQQDYAAASLEYEARLQQEPENLEARYFLGMCYYQLGKPGKAVLEFEKITDKNSPWYHEAKWHKALALIMKEDKSAAKATLQEIVNEGGPYRQNALAELAALGY